MDHDDIPGDAEEFAAAVDDITLTPDQHERLKDTVYTAARLQTFRTHDSRYLVAGAGANAPGDRYDRRVAVRDRLDARPDATALFLEDLGLGREELDLWFRTFDILCGEATAVVAVIEAHDGGVVAELGCIGQFEHRAKGWVLKRVYADDATADDRYTNPMAASIVAELAGVGRVLEWTDRSDLLTKTRDLP